MQPLVALVIPCLNEESFLLPTCRSLGFGIATTLEPDQYLCIVDNGSTDKTLEIAYYIQSSCPPGTVIIGTEQERGYIPPRHKGVLLVSELAKKKGVNPENVFLLQVDADTHYAPGYTKAMCNALNGAEKGTLVEGLTEYPDDFIVDYPLYAELTNSVDALLSSLFVEEAYDVVVDDKMVGYRLSDYFRWGGLKREFVHGDEMHAETTRLFMRAKVHACKRLRVQNAIGKHSMRKIVENPLLHFATAGFPREESWLEHWNALFPNTFKLKDFAVLKDSTVMREITNIRLQSLLALFTILPVHVARVLQIKDLIVPFQDEFVNLLPHREETDLLYNPAMLIKDVFDLIDNQGIQLIKKALHYSSRLTKRLHGSK